jgi:hypothetical protein
MARSIASDTARIASCVQLAAVGAGTAGVLLNWRHAHADNSTTAIRVITVLGGIFNAPPCIKPAY